MRLALDTNAYRVLHDGEEVLARHVRQAESVGVPIIVLGELRFGFMNGTRLAENEAVLEKFLATARVQVLQLTEATTHLFGEVATLLRRRGAPMQQDDIWIAALCKQYGYALATRDQGFAAVLGLRVIAC